MHKDPIESLFIGSNQIRLPSCHSTNAVASDLLAESDPPEGLVIITDDQTVGRGQRGNHWESQPGKNLTFSVILKPEFLPVARQFELTVITSLALIMTLDEIGLPGAQIKWPNDVYYSGRKIAGILIENTIRSTKLDWAVIGIGLNVNQKKFKVAGATSLRSELGRDLSLDKVLKRLLKQLQQFYVKLKTGNVDELRTLYTQNLMWLNQLRTFRNERLKTTFTGVILRVDQYGLLTVSVNNREMVFDFKEISFLN